MGEEQRGGFEQRSEADGHAGPGLTRSRFLRMAAGAGLTIPAANMLAACGGGGSSGDTKVSETATEEGKPVQGGTLRMARIGDVITWDPITPVDNISLWAFPLVYRGLLQVEETGTKLDPSIAESWEASPDGRTYTFHLRPDVKFADGSPLTASDVVFTFKREAGPKSLHASTIPPKTRFMAPDDRTVVVKLVDPSPDFADSTLGTAPILSEAYVREHGPKLPMGAGPFMLEEWRKGEAVILKRNPHYFGTGPYLDRVELLAIQDDTTRVLKLQAGEIDVATDLPLNQVKRIDQMSGVKTQTAPTLAVEHLRLNHHLPQFQDRNVRLAINHAIDKEAILKNVIFGYGEPATSLLPKLKYHVAQQPFAYDVEQAKAYMAKSGFPDGFSAKLLVLAGDQVESGIATIVQSQLAELGIKVDIQAVETGTKTELAQNEKYEMQVASYTSDYVDPFELVLFAAVNTFVDSAWTHYKNPTVNKLFEQAEREMDPAKRKELYAQMQKIVWDDAAYVFLYYPFSRSGVRDNVHGFKVLPTSYYLLETVWKS